MRELRPRVRHQVVGRMACLLLLGACHPWMRPTAVTPIAPDSSWTLYELPQFTIRLPPAYATRNAYGCFHADTSRVLYGPGWRDFCIELLSAADADLLSFAAESADTLAIQGPHTQCFDCIHYRAMIAGTVLVGGHRTLVQTAIGSGGINHVRNRPMMLIKIYLRPDRIAVVQGEYGDAYDLTELLGVMGTIALR